MNIFKPANEYAVMLLDISGGDKISAIKMLFAAQEEYNMPRSYVADVFNIITGN